MDEPNLLRVSQRAPRRCIECARRRIKCDRTIPCSECTKRGTASLCRREKVRLTTKAHDDCPDIRRPPPSRTTKPRDSVGERPVLSNDVHALQAELLKLRQRVRELEAANSAKMSCGSSACGGSTCASSPRSTEADPDAIQQASWASTKSEPWGLSPMSVEPTSPCSRGSSSKVSWTAVQEPCLPLDCRGTSVPSEVVQPPPPDDPKGQDTTNYELRQSLWSQAGTVYFEPSPHQDVYDQHRILCVTLFGWEYVRSRLVLSPLWDLLEQMYHACQWEKINSVTRLLILDFCWRVIKARAAGYVDGTMTASLLPNFCRPTDLEKLIPGNIMTQFYPWPGVRNAMLRNLNRYQTNAFTAAYLSQSRFLFPSVDEAFEKIPGTEILAFTPEWLRRRDDLNYYAITADFLEWYPELKGSIKAFTSIPALLLPADTSDTSKPVFTHIRGVKMRKLTLQESPQPAQIRIWEIEEVEEGLSSENAGIESKTGSRELIVVEAEPRQVRNIKCDP